MNQPSILPYRSQLDDLIRACVNCRLGYAESVREFRKRFVETVLAQNKGNKCKAARQLGMHRNTLSRTMADLGIGRRAYYRARIPNAVTANQDEKQIAL